MSIKPYPIFINSTLYTKTWKDELYNQLNNYLYNIGKFRTLTDKSDTLAKIGRGDKATIIYEELFYYGILIDYLINAKETIYRSTFDDDNTVEDLLETYEFDKIRKNLLCRFNTTRIFDALLRIANFDQEGIDEMIVVNTEITDEDFIVE